MGTPEIHQAPSDGAFVRAPVADDVAVRVGALREIASGPEAAILARLLQRVVTERLDRPDPDHVRIEVRTRCFERHGDIYHRLVMDTPRAHWRLPALHELACQTAVQAGFLHEETRSIEIGVTFHESAGLSAPE